MALQDILYWPISGCHTHVFDFDANPNKTHSQLTSLLNYVILGCRPHFFFCISASLQIVKIKIMNYSIQFQRMVEKKQNGSSSINPAPLARPCLLPAHVRFAEWKHTIALFTGGVRWRRYRHSIKFVYSLHEYEYVRDQPHEQHYQLTEISRVHHMRFSFVFFFLVLCRRRKNRRTDSSRSNRDP